MVTKCANPSCENLFHYFRDSRLFLQEIPPAPPGNGPEWTQPTSNREFFWLCDTCALTMTLIADKDGHMVLISLPQTLKAA